MASENLPGNLPVASIAFVNFNLLIGFTNSFRGLDEGFQGFRPQIRIRPAEISPGTNFGVM